MIGAPLKSLGMPSVPGPLEPVAPGLYFKVWFRGCASL